MKHMLHVHTEFGKFLKGKYFVSSTPGYFTFKTSVMLLSDY